MKPAWYLKSIPVRSYRKDTQTKRNILFIFLLCLVLLGFMWLAMAARAETITLTASWYSVQSLKTEGTWKTSKGAMANGENFKDEASTCAVWGFPLGTYLKVRNVRNGKSVIVRVTDRISRRFKDTRIDLSRSSFEKIADLKEGLVKVEVSRV